MVFRPPLCFLAGKEGGNINIIDGTNTLIRGLTQTKQDMSKISNYLFQEANWLPIESDIREIRNIVLEEAGFKWIPVSEMLPEQVPNTSFSVAVLYSKDNEDVAYGNYNYMREQWYDIRTGKFYEKERVLAWMPKPKPYQP